MTKVEPKQGMTKTRWRAYNCDLGLNNADSRPISIPSSGRAALFGGSYDVSRVKVVLWPTTPTFITAAATTPPLCANSIQLKQSHYECKPTSSPPRSSTSPTQPTADSSLWIDFNEEHKVLKGVKPTHKQAEEWTPLGHHNPLPPLSNANGKPRTTPCPGHYLPPGRLAHPGYDRRSGLKANLRGGPIVQLCMSGISAATSKRSKTNFGEGANSQVRRRGARRGGILAQRVSQHWPFTTNDNSAGTKRLRILTPGSGSEGRKFRLV